MGGFIVMKIRKSVKRAMHLLQIEKLRRNQLKPINEILDGHDTMVIAPTSFGKSLLYLIPALTQDTGITIVIEPLLALIHDQVYRLRKEKRKTVRKPTGTPISRAARRPLSLPMIRRRQRRSKTRKVTRFPRRMTAITG